MSDLIARLRNVDLLDDFARLEAADEIERLRRPWRNVDATDWEYIMDALGDRPLGGDRFWKAVLTEMRGALTPNYQQDATE